MAALTTPLVHPMPRLDDGRVAQITSGYGPRVGGHYSFHYGADLFYPHRDEPLAKPETTSNGKWSVRNGIPALAMAPGRVVKSSWLSTGDRVRIDHGGGFETAAMHLRDRKVQVGDRVSAGQPIGIVSFDPTGPGVNHLHQEVYRDGQTVDPAPYIAAARVMGLPSNWGIWVGIGASVAGGLLLAKYVFR